MEFHIVNYWKRSCDKNGIYFEFFGFSANWGKYAHPILHHVTIVLLNFELSLNWMSK